jgi:lipoprotein signal peptidase
MAIGLFLLLACAGLAGDLLSKHYVFHSFLDDPNLPRRMADHRARFAAHYGRAMTADEALSTLRRRVGPGVWFSLSTNAGVVFGLPMPRWGTALASVVAMALVGLCFATSDRRAAWLHAALALILAGALGNLYDRLFGAVSIPGYQPIRYQVRDFIDCSELHYRWVFNIADVLLVVGVAMLIGQRLVAVLWARRHRDGQ